MRRSDSVDFVFQLAALVVALIIVHALYVTVVRPRADTFSAEQAALMAAAGCDGIELGTDAVDDDQLARLGKSLNQGFDPPVIFITGTVKDYLFHSLGHCPFGHQRADQSCLFCLGLTVPVFPQLRVKG